MFISVFDIFKIGVGPSSSHTMGPMTAGGLFLDELRTRRIAGIERLGVRLYGSLAWTGKGHASDRAAALGLMGFAPATLDPDAADAAFQRARETGVIEPEGLEPVAFNPDVDVVLDFDETMPGHANGLRFFAWGADRLQLHARGYYSIGGGFVVDAESYEASGGAPPVDEKALAAIPYPFRTADEMLAMGAESGLSIAAMKRANERHFHDDAEIDARLDDVWRVMDACMTRGLKTGGELPGGLKVRRRAAAMRAALEEERGLNRRSEHQAMDWLSTYAMAVNEENAAGGRVVTAPTNGAAGVAPAVLRYYLDHVPGASRNGVRDFLLAAAAVGAVIKINASISGAEVGCQGEVGSAAAMAAAGLAQAMGATNAQIENAAEIALEHHLGMTCDPVAGLVQVPCIERNAMGAVKAVAAASLAMRGDGRHLVSLDACVRTMRDTGRDMSERYKETSTGGLAVNVAVC